MNIIKIQDELRSVPDQALVGYVQNPTGHVPTYLALSELNRRKEMREKFQQAQPEKKTVAEEIVQESQPQMPQGGVAQLPEAQPMMQAMQPPPEMPVQQMAQGGLADLAMDNDMFNEESYAGGGIVAFADGGDTETHLNVNTGKQQAVSSPVSNELSALARIFPWFGLPGGELYASKNPDSLIPWFGMLSGGSKNSLEQLTPKSYALNVESGKQEAQYAHGGEVQHYADGGATSRFGDFMRSLGNPAAAGIDKQIGALQAEKERIRGDIFRSYTPEQKAAQAQRITEIDAQIADLSAQRKGGAPNTPTNIPGPNVMGSEASANVPGQNPLTGLLNPNVPMQYPPGNTIPGANVKPPVSPDAGVDYGFEKVKGIGDYAKELQDYIGTDPAKAALQERLSKMDAAAAKQAEQAPWLALAQAGFTMANQRAEYGKAAETPLAAAARGAGAGLKDYIESKDKLNKLEERRFDIANDLAKANRAEQIAVAKFGADSKQAVEARNAHAKLQQAHDRVQIQMNREDNAVRLAAATTKTGMDAKQILDAKEKIRSGNPTYLNWVNEMKKKSKNIVNTPEFKQAEEDLVNELVKREGSLTATPTIDTTGWKLR